MAPRERRKLLSGRLEGSQRLRDFSPGTNNKSIQWQVLKVILNFRATGKKSPAEEEEETTGEEEENDEAHQEGDNEEEEGAEDAAEDETQEEEEETTEESTDVPEPPKDTEL